MLSVILRREVLVLLQHVSIQPVSSVIVRITHTRPNLYKDVNVQWGISCICLCISKIFSWKVNECLTGLDLLSNSEMFHIIIS
jgi:hypothetical protein